MKKLLIICSLSIFALLSCEKESVISETDLSAEIKSYINTHFLSCNIVKVVKDKENSELSFDIDLDCGVNLEFNGDNKVIDIDGISKLPDSVIPVDILSYVSANYPNNTILGWEIEGQNQHIDLNNSLVLEFNMTGDFLRIVN